MQPHYMLKVITINIQTLLILVNYYMNNIN